MTTNPTYRVGVYLDGAFLRNVGVYFNYGPLHYGWVDYHGLQELIEERVSTVLRAGDLSGVEGKNPSLVNIVRCSLYDGRSPEVKDKSLDRRLSEANITARLFPLQERTDSQNGKTVMVQKGIQSELICDALAAAFTGQYDIAVLVTGDQEFVPLVRTLQEANRPVVVLYFSIPEWVDSNGSSHRPTSASHRLLNAATFSFDVCEEIRLKPHLASELFSV